MTGEVAHAMSSPKNTGRPPLPPFLLAAERVKPAPSYPLAEHREEGVAGGLFGLWGGNWNAVCLSSALSVQDQLSTPIPMRSSTGALQASASTNMAQQGGQQGGQGSQSAHAIHLSTNFVLYLL